MRSLNEYKDDLSQVNTITNKNMTKNILSGIMRSFMKLYRGVFDV